MYNSVIFINVQSPTWVGDDTNSDRSTRPIQHSWRQRSRENKASSVATNYVDQVCCANDVATNVTKRFTCYIQFTHHWRHSYSLSNKWIQCIRRSVSIFLTLTTTYTWQPNKHKLSCREETGRCCMSLNISLSLKVTQGHSKWHQRVGRMGGSY